MNSTLKIHLLLALVCIGLFITALIARNTYTPEYSLKRTGSVLERNLREKELVVQNILNDSLYFKKFRNLGKDEKIDLKLIESIQRDKNINFITYIDNEPVFWSSNLIVPDNAGYFKDGRSFNKESNGYYELIKKTEGNFSVLFFILVKPLYPYNSLYLRSVFSKDLTKDEHIDIADFTDTRIYQVSAIDQTFLFSVKQLSYQINSFFYIMEFLLWASAVLFLCLLVHRLCAYISNRGFAFYSVLFLAVFIILVRFINLHYRWPDVSGNLQIFNPAFYASNEFFPSFGDFLINLLAITWLAVYLYYKRNQVLKPVISKTQSYMLYVFFVAALIAVSYSLLNMFKGLILNSTINFDITNVIDLDPFRIIGGLLVCLSFLNFYLLSETFLSISQKINITHRRKLLVFLGAISTITLIELCVNSFTGYYFLWGAIVILLGYKHYYKRGKLSPLLVISAILIAATICAIQLFDFQRTKDYETRKVLIQRLLSADDPNADAILEQIEDDIITDPAVIEFYNDTARNYSYLSNHLQKTYFDGYLSKYDFDIYLYNKKNEDLSGEKQVDIKTFKSQVLYSSIKRGKYFYHVNNAFGMLNYFSLLPIRDKGVVLGTMVIKLKLKSIQNQTHFTGLFIETTPKLSHEFVDYNYALYVKDTLESQSGKYPYRLVTKFKGAVNKYTSESPSSEDAPPFTHLTYRSNANKLVVVSKEEPNFFYRISALSFFFTLFIILMFLAMGIGWLSRQHINFRFRNLKWIFLVSNNRILYKTRIQISMVITVVFTLLMVGIITFIFISSDYESKQDESMQEKILQVTQSFDNKAIEGFGSKHSDERVFNFSDFAKRYGVDLTLFDVTGKMLLTTQPKLFDYGIISNRMNAIAYISLKEEGKSKVINEENIGNLPYKAIYVPIRNDEKNVVAYLQLPYFSTDYRSGTGHFVNMMINIYAFVFVGIGLFAVFVANQITSPLTMIQHSLSNTQYGHKNEPIMWRRNDEIGSLIKEYNNMISALEDSASRLAQTERELAWREMAKQVAHEIKNPLTPLKLGLQLLEKSWKDKDPRFDQKFEKFSKSFIEQIESLSNIATEFSNFAKMPEAKAEKVDLFDLIDHSVNMFKKLEGVKIVYEHSSSSFFINADKDQIKRCFNNLLKNAIEAIPPNRQKIININYEINTMDISIRIKDNGKGIPEALREKIFEPNFTTKSSGTGLGLAFVKNAIQHIGGNISFETADDVGTTFYITLPITSV
ncbi:MAG: ATP-binding protein [Sphingobacteriaceae bacterium]